MSKKYNVTFRKSLAEEDKFITIQVGVAYKNEQGHLDIVLNAIPIDWDGRLRIWINDEEKEISEEL